MKIYLVMYQNWDGLRVLEIPTAFKSYESAYAACRNLGVLCFASMGEDETGHFIVECDLED